MSLRDAVDDLLAHVESAPRQEPRTSNSVFPVLFTREWLERFDELDRMVWVEACRLGHQDKLPPEPHTEGLHKLGLTNLPATSKNVWPTADWWGHMLALRELDQTAKRGRKRKRGPYRTSYDREAEAKLYDDWEAAKESGTRRIADFARDRGLDENEVRETIERVRSRRRRMP